MKKFRLDRALDGGTDGVAVALRVEANRIRVRLQRRGLRPHKRRILKHRLVTLGLLLIALADS